jgi:hypothetical protein
MRHISGDGIDGSECVFVGKSIKSPQILSKMRVNCDPTCQPMAGGFSTDSCGFTGLRESTGSGGEPLPIRKRDKCYSHASGEGSKWVIS